MRYVRLPVDPYVAPGFLEQLRAELVAVSQDGPLHGSWGALTSENGALYLRERNG